MEAGTVNVKYTGDLGNLHRVNQAAIRELQTLKDKAIGAAGSFGSIASAAGPAGIAVGVAMGGAVMAVSALGKALVDATKQFAKTGSDLADLSAKTGISTDALQQLGFAGKMVGVSMQEIGQAANLMQKNIANGSSVFERLGLSLEKIRSMNTEQQFMAVAAQIQKIPDPARQAAAAMEVFGRSGAQLLPLLKSDLAGLAEEARRLGIVMSQENVAAADELDDSLTKLGMTWDGFVNNLAAAVTGGGNAADAINTLTEKLGALSKWFADNKAIFVGFFEVMKNGFNELLAQVSRIPGVTMAMAGLSKILGAQAEQFRFIGQHLLDSRGKTGTSIPGSGGFSSSDDTRRAQAAREKDIEQARELFEMYVAVEDAVADANRELARSELFGSGVATMPGMEPVVPGSNTPFGGIGAVLSDAADAKALKDAGAAERFAFALKESERTGRGFTKILEEIEKGTYNAERVSVDWSQALANVAHAFQVLGISANSALGKVLGGVSAGGAALDSLKKSSAAQGGGIGGLLKGGIGNVLNNLGAGMQLASAAIGIGKAIGGLFTSSPAEKAAKGAMQELGVKVSKELAEAIAKTSKETGVGMREAALLNLSGVMGESGKDPRTFSKNVINLMEAVKLEAVPAGKGIAEIGKAFNLVADAAKKAGSIADRELVAIIKRSRELGQTIPEVKAFVAQELATAAQGVGGMVKGLQLITPEDAIAQATIFAETFRAIVAEEGIAKAAEMMRESFNALEEKLKAGGFDVDAIFGDVRAMMNLAGNEKFAGASQGVAGLQQALGGLGNAGVITQQSMDAIGQQTQKALEQALAGGASQQQALQLVAPILRDLVNASENSGLELSEPIKALVAQLGDNGIALLQEPAEKQVSLLTQIRDILSGGGGGGGISLGGGGLRDPGDLSIIPGGLGGGTRGPSMAGISYSPNVTVNAGGMGARQAAAVVDAAINRNVGGLKSRIRRVGSGRE